MTPDELRERLHGRKANDRLWTFSTVIATISLIVALTSAGATAYYNFFWNLENVRVFFRWPDMSQIGSDRMNIDLVISNIGKQTAILAQITLVQIEGKDIGLDQCANHDIIDWRAFKERQQDTTSRQHFYGRNIDVSFRNPDQLEIDNVVSKSVVVIEPSKQRLINAVFRPYAADLKKTDIVECLLFQIFDRNGENHLVLLPGVRTYLRPGAGSFYEWISDQQSFRLLPTD